MDNIDVFLSHASQDRDLVERVLDEIRGKLPKISVWVDFESLKPGDDWAEEVVRAASGASIFIVFGTSAAFESRWVQQEIGIGFQKRIFEKVPLVFLAFDPELIPADLKRYQYIDFRDFASGLDRLTMFLADQFNTPRRATRYRTIDSIPDRTIAKGVIYAHVSCPEILSALPKAELRRRLCKGLSRKQLSVVWFDVLEDRMDDELPEQPLANCAMELLLRCDQRHRMPELFQSVCSDHPHIAKTT